jgi:hypothetical protein
MEPTIFDGEVITINQVEPSKIRNGDILLYRSESRLTAHRVIRIEKKKPHAPTRSPCLTTHDSVLSPQSSFVLRADTSNTVYEQVEPSQILGKVVSVERNGYRIRLGGAGARVSYKVRVVATRLKRNLLRILSKTGVTH